MRNAGGALMRRIPWIRSNTVEMKIAAEKVWEMEVEFRSGEPYGYASVGSLFDTSLVSLISKEVESHLAQVPQEKNFYGSYGKLRLSLLEDMPDRTRDFITCLNSPAFLRVLSDISGIEDLCTDL